VAAARPGEDGQRGLLRPRTRAGNPPAPPAGSAGPYGPPGTGEPAAEAGERLEVGPLLVLPLGENLPPFARARPTPPTGANTANPSPAWPLAATPGSKAEARKAAETLRQASLDLRRISARHVRHLVAVFFAAGWTPGDVLHALDHTPDGRPWPYAGTPRHVPGWVRHRLRPWLDADGRPARSKSQRLAAAAAAERARQQAWREELAERHARSLGGPLVVAPRMPRAEALAPAPAPAASPTVPTGAYLAARAALNARLATRP
jgi:hypothetical protein